ncbi:MAG: glycosyltransferase family 4 protein [Aequorivita sp.]|nr:glycosyltransferase family 4 protein [Aequorivita sp.]MCB0746006.1 glycosyltransferase family 4 protein [Ignavibacteriota bacterium]
MKIIVLGTRGIPDILGGVETHCQELYPRIATQGHDITVITRTPYVENKKRLSYKGVKLKHIYAPKKKSLEAIIHTFLGILYAGYKRPDVLHIHAVGPMILTPLARLLGLKVVVTNHGPDYDRQKWGKLAKTMLKTGERLGTKFANKVIVISNVINSIIKNRYGREDAFLIYNGVNFPTPSKDDDYLKSLGLEKKQYLIAVGRFVEEKGFHDLIEAYTETELPWKLVLVGDADHETNYSKELKEKAKRSNVILTGFIKGEQLNEIFTHARLFVMPSYHEGLPIALLEAMSYNLDVLVSNIPANLEVDLESPCYFDVGNLNDLRSKLNSKNHANITSIDYSRKLKSDYNWDTIAGKVVTVYNDV